MYHDDLTEREKLIYFAGIIDGEGHIGRSVYSGVKRPVIALSMTDKEVVTHFADHFNLVTREGNSPSRIASYAIGHKQQYNCRAETQKACAIIRQLRPFMITKAAAADDALAYYQDRTCATCNTPLSELATRQVRYCSAECRRNGWKQGKSRWTRRRKKVLGLPQPLKSSSNG